MVDHNYLNLLYIIVEIWSGKQEQKQHKVGEKIQSRYKKKPKHFD